MFGGAHAHSWGLSQPWVSYRDSGHKLRVGAWRHGLRQASCLGASPASQPKDPKLETWERRKATSRVSGDPGGFSALVHATCQ